MMDTNRAVHFLSLLGCQVSREAVLEAERLICRQLQFAITSIEPLTFVETLLEVLGGDVDTVWSLSCLSVRLPL